MKSAIQIDLYTVVYFIIWTSEMEMNVTFASDVFINTIYLSSQCYNILVKIQLSFTHTQVISNLYDLLKHKRKHFE